jgi:hypothetical protein
VWLRPLTSLDVTYRAGACTLGSYRFFWCGESRTELNTTTSNNPPPHCAVRHSAHALLLLLLLRVAATAAPPNQQHYTFGTGWLSSSHLYVLMQSSSRPHACSSSTAQNHAAQHWTQQLLPPPRPPGWLAPHFEHMLGGRGLGPAAGTASSSWQRGIIPASPHHYLPTHRNVPHLTCRVVTGLQG